MVKTILDGIDSLSTRNLASMTRIARLVPESLMEFRARLAFNELIRWAAEKSPHYRKKFAEHNIDPACVHDISDLKDFFTWPEEVQEDPESFLCAPPHLVFETSGTTGTPKRAYFSYQEIERLARYEACALYYLGARSLDRILCTFDQGFWVTGPVTEAALRHLNVFGSVVGKLDPQDAFERIQRDRYTILMADPTWLQSLTEVARQAQRVPPLKLILCGGDRLPEVNRREAERVWNCPVLQGYGTTETAGVVATECLQRDGLHLDPFNLKVEIVEKDDTGFGEIVVTTLTRRVMPLIRYRTRDVARFVEGTCACGAKVPRISTLKARRDEMVIMGAGNLYPLMLERLLERIPGWAGLWQVAVLQEPVAGNRAASVRERAANSGLRSAGGKLSGLGSSGGGRQELTDILEFRVVADGHISLPDLEQRIKEQIRRQQPGMWANLQCGMYQVRVVEAKQQFMRHRKVRCLVDER